MVSSNQKVMYFDVLNAPSISFSERDTFCYFRALPMNVVTVDRRWTHTEVRRATKRHRRTRHDRLGFFRDTFVVFKLQTMPLVQQATTVNLLCYVHQQM